MHFSSLPLVPLSRISNANDVGGSQTLSKHGSGSYSSPKSYSPANTMTWDDTLNEMADSTVAPDELDFAPQRYTSPQASAETYDKYRGTDNYGSQVNSFDNGHEHYGEDPDVSQKNENLMSFAKKIHAKISELEKLIFDVDDRPKLLEEIRGMWGTMLTTLSDILYKSTTE